MTREEEKELERKLIDSLKRKQHHFMNRLQELNVLRHTSSGEFDLVYNHANKLTTRIRNLTGGTLDVPTFERSAGISALTIAQAEKTISDIEND